MHGAWNLKNAAYVPGFGNDRAGLPIPTSICVPLSCWSRHTKDLSGSIPQVTRITPRRGPPVDVFNFEVDVDHVYHVGTTGVLVHNSCNPLRVNMIDEFGHPGAGWQAAHIIPKKVFSWAPKELDDIRKNVAAHGLIDNVANGFWSTQATGHAGTYTSAYSTDLIDVMQNRTTKSDILDGIDELWNRIKAGNY